MPNATWKATERRVAAILGGDRVGCTGEASPDVVTDWLAVEVKHRRALPAWLKAALAQAKANAPEGKLPVVILHEHGRHDSLVLLSMRDFAEWFGE